MRPASPFPSPLGERRRQDGDGFNFIPLHALTEAESAAAPFSSRPDPLEEEDCHRWANTLIERTFTQLRLEFALSGRTAWFDQLHESVRDDPRRFNFNYRVHAERLGANPATVMLTVIKMKRRYLELLRDELARAPLDVPAMSVTNLSRRLAASRR